jgi:hypothetical protein
MAVFAGPSIVNLNNGLVLHYDAADNNSYQYRENQFAYSEQFNQAA